MPELAISDVEYARHAAIKGSDKLLARLREYHGEVEDEPEPVKPEPIKEVLPPIPNKAVEAACKIAFPANRTDIIQRAVLAEFPKITMTDMKSQRRTGPVVYVRQLAMYMVKTLTMRSLPEIGRQFGGRDHTTVLHAVRKFERMVSEDPALAALVQRIQDNLPDFQT